MDDPSWVSHFFVILERIFPGDAVGKGLQRGFMIGGTFFFVEMMIQIYLKPPGSWFYYHRMQSLAVSEAEGLSDSLATQEGGMSARKEHLDSLLKELDVYARPIAVAEK